MHCASLGWRNGVFLSLFPPLLCIFILLIWGRSIKFYIGEFCKVVDGIRSLTQKGQSRDAGIARDSPLTFFRCLIFTTFVMKLFSNGKLFVS